MTFYPVQKLRAQVPAKLSSTDLTLKVELDNYRKIKNGLQKQLAAMQKRLYKNKKGLVLVFEGWDTAGKGGVIKRFTQPLDARFFRVTAVGAPRGEEAERHYLWRFWRQVPPKGHIAIFDRSWYGRVLVEKVEKISDAQRIERAYSELCEFEKAMTDHGYTVLKFWLHISPDEQLRRLEARKKNAFKRWKLTEEDWRNREKWDDYAQATEEMLNRTTTDNAPWYIIPAEQKHFARLAVMQTILSTVS